MASSSKRNKQIPIYTHEGGKASQTSLKEQLKRSVMACMLWEDTFYEDGYSVKTRIDELCEKVNSKDVLEIAFEAKHKMKLRHVPLQLLVALARKGDLKASAVEALILRADELTELLSLYWKDGKCSISSQLKKGLAKAFTKFDEYQLAKYNRPNSLKLRDVLFLCHAKPKDAQQEDLWKRLILNKLETPDTWEVSLSTGKDKKATWERLIQEHKLGDLAFLKNLRNMLEVGVNKKIIIKSLNSRTYEKILPFRFIAAARYNPSLEKHIETAMLQSLVNNDSKKIKGKTVLLIDVSISMSSNISKKSDLNRIDAACALAILAREVYSDVEIFSFSDYLQEVPPRRGFSLSDAIKTSQPHDSTMLGSSLRKLNERIDYDRLIIFTDEQSTDNIPIPKSKIKNSYIINVASDKNGIGYGDYIHINGFSEAVLDYIINYENEFLKENKYE